MENPPNVISLRLATSADEPALHALIETSVRVLQKNDYTPEQIDGALGTLLGLDTQLVADGTYLVAEAEAACARIIVGCGGWSHRKTLFGSDHAPIRQNEFLNPATDAAKIRAFFIHPDWARRGLGSKILRSLRIRRPRRGLLPLRNGRHAHWRSTLLSPWLPDRRAHRSPPAQRRCAANRPHDQVRRAGVGAQFAQASAS